MRAESTIAAMISVAIVAITVMIIWSLSANSSDAGDIANAESNSISQAILENQSVAGAVINYPANTTSQHTATNTNTVRTSGKTEIQSSGELRTAPSLGGLALGGGHPCAYAPATAQISIIGGGIGAGGMKVDTACMLMVMGAAGDAKAYAAAQYMLAARDSEACTAMKSAGMVGACPRDKKPAAATTASAKNVQAAPTPWKTCDFDVAKNTIRFQPRAGSDKVAQKTACLASHGF